ncbi:peptidoglycan D,D-transpeptidase FtsI family protein [Lederbergia galactosidilytica]|uniref:serine-type D-Ala-D-Ala carboxypeptidase n=1 Tax=Lederbergia galactosidilytica TaxID=217031 RepID=A0A178A1A4_9BACI|nr:penicillin-binding protein 2 [Lederbergia galactosidilytica]OAK73892.1 penicillin-binding protein [Lederbergia galactosidilytica]
MNNKIHKAKLLRFNFLIFIIFCTFILLIIRLGYLQITKGEDFDRELNQTDVVIVEKPVPRGSVYDRHHRLLVGNRAVETITYFRDNDVTSDDMLEIAENLTKYISIDHNQLKLYDLQAYFFAKYPERINKRLTKDEQQLEKGELYEAQLAKVTDQDLATLSESDKSVAMIYKKMNSISTFNIGTIKNKQVTDEEVAKVSENLSQLPGIDVTIDWERDYHAGDMLRSVFGSVTTKEVGLPSDQQELLLAKDYALNDRVGSSYLEKGYEDVLKGAKEQYELIINKGERDKSVLRREGKKGDNLVLTIDLDFQKKLEDIATNTLIQRRGKLADRLYIVATNPQNGEILGMVGKRLNMTTGKVEDDTLGVFNSQYTMGSSIKGATVLAGYMDQVISLDDNTLVDKPLKFAETKSKSSWFNRNGRVVLNDLSALETSSNSYMMQLALRMGGKYDYTYDERLQMDSEQVFRKLRYYLAQFGLGVLTGVDLPGETPGLKGLESNPGLALDLSFGQFDTYTTLQLNQYISTIANGGKRIAPRIVKEIRGNTDQGEIGELKTLFSPKILNHVDIDGIYIDRVKSGLYNVVHGSHQHGTGKRLAQLSYKVAAKTGTAQAFYSGPVQSANMRAVWNLTFVGYAPADHPEIAVSVALPYMDTDKEEAILDIPRKVFDAYFES